MPTPEFDDVLSTAPPTLTEAEAAAVAEGLFGVSGAAKSLGSERDQTFLIEGANSGVMKVSNAAENPARLDLEATTVFRIAEVDPSLPVALPRRALAGEAHDGPDVAAFRAAHQVGEATHWVRMYELMSGDASVPEVSLSDAAVRSYGETIARLGRAMRGITHPLATRTLLWDPQNALSLRPLLDAVTDSRVRGLVERTLDRYERVVPQVWPMLRQQVIHGDLSADNVLLDPDGMITGIIDFGDISFTAVIVDIVSVIESMVAGRHGDNVFRTARIALDGFERVVPLEPAERAIFAEVLGARACAAAVIPAWRSQMYDDPDALMPTHRQDADELLTLFDEVGYDEVARRLVGRESAAPASVADLRSRRETVLGSALTELTYEQPLHIVRSDGPWLFDSEGTRYLDAYNNVPVVGHAHPRVTGAIARQARVLNTNMRYLHESVLDVAERLVETTNGELDTVMFVNSGSEANDLAWRLATAATGNTGGLCTAWAYHGVSEAITALSPEVWPNRERPAHIEAWSAPDPYRGVDLDPAAFGAAIERLAGHGYSPAVAILDGVLTSDGILELDPVYVQSCVDQLHAAGGLWIADEVQGGYGRTGEAMWSYQRFGITPDFVTLGKPMGNGHPVAAVITRSDIVDRFAETTDYFSTFGGNPVATAAAAAVLDVIEDERILDNARETGSYLRDRLRELQSDFPNVMGDVRGMGLANAVEIVSDAPSKTPDPDRAGRIMNQLRQSGVLVGTTGQLGNTLKIRPPLVFKPAEADLLAATLGKVLAAGD